MSRVSMADLVRDLRDESDDLASLLAGVAEESLALPTPAEGWSIHDQLTHLAYFDDAATQAATAPAEFEVAARRLMELGPDFVDRIAADHRSMPAADVLTWLASSRGRLLETFAAVPAGTRLPWFGPSMSAASCLTARLMETWAHGQDVADALGHLRTPTARLRHVAHLGVITRPFSFQLRERPVPDAPVRVELGAPDGSTWEWGEAGAADAVRGPALDFCLVVTQRRHLDDTALEVTGPAATEWMGIAQAFAGSPGPGRAPARGEESA